jgi:heat-inducible transcriptional repressor
MPIDPFAELTEAELTELTERQRNILRMVVQEYVETAQPVGSTVIARRGNLGVSPATIRNELAALERQGLLTHPHTSAGRIPTDAGYRFFVPPAERRYIRIQFSEASQEMDQWLRLSTSLLARTTQAAALATAPRSHQSRYKHVELVAIHGVKVLIVLVLQQGTVLQQMVDLDEPAAQPDLSKTSNELNDRLAGLGANAIARLVRNSTVDARFDAEINAYTDTQHRLTVESKDDDTGSVDRTGGKRGEPPNDSAAGAQNERQGPGQDNALSSFAAQVADLIAHMMQRLDREGNNQIYRDGLTQVLDLPEFAEGDNVRRIVHVFEEQSLLEQVVEDFDQSLSGLGGNLAESGREWQPERGNLDRGTLDRGSLDRGSLDYGNIHVLIAGDGRIAELRDISIVLARYGVIDEATGILGVIGPLRMSYRRAMGAVRYVSGLMSERVEELYGRQDQE